MHLMQGLTELKRSLRSSTVPKEAAEWLRQCEQDKKGLQSFLRSGGEASPQTLPGRLKEAPKPFQDAPNVI